jgi:Transposase IS66 family
MPRKARQMISALKTKGFLVDEDRHHIFLIYETIDGRKTSIRTRVSHQSGGSDIGDRLLGAMARQTKLTRWPAFTRVLEDGRICFSNNAAERALRGLALGRKSWLFAGSERGAERAAFMYTSFKPRN